MKIIIYICFALIVLSSFISCGSPAGFLGRRRGPPGQVDATKQCVGRVVKAIEPKDKCTADCLQKKTCEVRANRCCVWAA